MAENDTPDTIRSSKRLPIARQIWIVAGLAAVIFVAIGLEFGADTLFGSPAPVPVNPFAGSAGVFKPTAQQLASLTIKPVQAMAFRSETVTDGFIAVDDDLSTPVFSPFSGRVTKVVGKLGDRVAKGAPLLTVQASEFVQAQSDLTTAVAQYNLAETNENRQHALYESEGAALKDWQQSQVDLATAEGALAAVRNRLRILGKTDQDIAALEKSPKAQLDDAETVVTAPIAGTIVQRQVGVGQYIQSGASSPVFSVGDLSTVWLIANVRETDAPLMHVGDPIEVHVLAFPNRVFKATVSYVAPAIDPATHRLTVRATIDNRDGALKPQMFANFTIVTGADVKAPGVPQSAIVYEGENARVWIVAADGEVSLREIEIGRTADDFAEVVRGLQVGDRVVTSGALFIDRAATGG